MVIKILGVLTSRLISHVLSKLLQLFPHFPQYRSNTINITVRLLEGSLQFVVYCKVEMWWKASIFGGEIERERERERHTQRFRKREKRN
jgi:hypothetical protein